MFERLWRAITSKVWLVVSYLILGTALHVFVSKMLGLPVWAYFSLLVGIGAVDLLADLRPRFAALLYASRRGVTIFLAAASALLGVVLFLVGVWLNGELPTASLWVSFTLQGITVGALLRVLMTAYFKGMISNADTHVARLTLFAGMSIVVGLCPTSVEHRSLAGLFFVGLAAGFLFHFLVRRHEHSQAEEDRLLQNVANTLGASKQALRPLELQAISAFAAKKWRRLDRLLAKADFKSTHLQLVDASRCRLLGDYVKALRILDDELARARREPRDLELDSLVHLQRALNFGEQDRASEMHAALAVSMELDGNSVLTQVTAALRRAEDAEVQWTDAGTVEPSDGDRDDPLRLMWRALKVNELPRTTELLTAVTGTTVPVTWTFLLDSYGYVLLKAGRWKFAKSLFEQCIRTDPTFASPYLHLGEWHILAARAQNRQSGHADRRLAELCLHIAIHQQKGRDSLVKRRAKSLLESLNASNDHN